MNRSSCYILAAMLLIVSLLLSGFMDTPDADAQPKDYPDPTPRKEQILELFVKEFIALPVGGAKLPVSFTMGSDKEPANAQPAHKVTFTQPFAMAKYEVTQELYQVVMGNNPAKWKGPRNSVEMMDWAEANSFCQKVTAELKKRKLIGDGDEIRLPTEAEWEFVCRAGTTTNYSFGDDVTLLTQYSWYKDNSKGYDPPVGAKKANAWGFYDMHGYINEWCADDYVAGYKDAPTDGSARQMAGVKEKVIRGGSYADAVEVHQSAYRGHAAATARIDTLGFRCVKSAAKKGAADAK